MLRTREAILAMAAMLSSSNWPLWVSFVLLRWMVFVAANAGADAAAHANFAAAEVIVGAAPDSAHVCHI